MTWRSHDRSLRSTVNLYYADRGAQAQGVDMAIATTARSEAPYIVLRDRGAQVEGVDMAIATTARSEAPSHLFLRRPRRAGSGVGTWPSLLRSR